MFPVKKFRINPDGSFSICGQHFQIMHYNSIWKAAVQSEKNVMLEKGYPKYENGMFSLNAVIRTSAGPVHFFQESKRLAEREIISSCKLPKTSRNSQIVLETVFPLPAGGSLDLELDQKTLVIPKESDEKKIMFVRTPKTLNVFQSQGFFSFPD